MFFLFPIRSESRVRRFPVVTVSLIGFNFLVFFFTYPIMLRQAKIIESKRLSLRNVENRIVAANAKIRDDFSDILVYASPNKRQVLREKIKNREIEVPDELWEEWEEAYDEFQESLNGRLVKKYGFVSTDFNIVTLITSMFLHGGWMHLIGNMWFLWLVGINVEDDWGRPFFLGFYVVAGIFASLLFAAMTHSQDPLIGASGAIAGIMGAFAIQYYKSKIYFLFVLFFPLFIFKIFPLFAWFYLPLWFIKELFSAIYFTDSSSVAFWAHVGGFGFGMLGVFLLRYSGLEEQFLTPLVNDTLNLMNTDFGKAVEARTLGDTEKAEEYLEGILQKDPANLDASKELIDIYNKKGRKKEAALQAKETFRVLRVEKKEPSIILGFYEDILKGKDLFTALSPYDFYFVSDLYKKTGQLQKASKVLATAYREKRKTDDAPYILLRLIRILALNKNKKFLKKALSELTKRFPEMKNKALAVLREIRNEKNIM